MQQKRMAIERPRGHLGCIVLLLGIALGGCTPTAPEVRVLVPLPRRGEAAVYLTAARQREEIARALRDAGFQLAEHVDDAPYYLRVTIGTDQGSQACGTLNNVRYDLRWQGRSAVVAEAKGWTGRCEPNVFDAVSRELRRRVVEATSAEGQVP